MLLARWYSVNSSRLGRQPVCRNSTFGLPTTRGLIAGQPRCLRYEVIAFRHCLLYTSRSEGGAHADAYVVVIRKADVLNPIQQAVEDGVNLIQQQGDAGRTKRRNFRLRKGLVLH